MGRTLTRGFSANLLSLQAGEGSSHYPCFLAGLLICHRFREEQCIFTTEPFFFQYSKEFLLPAAHH